MRNIVDDGVDVDDAHLHYLPPAESQHLFGESCRAISRIGNLQERFAQGTVRSDLVQHHLGRQLDDHQNVVEVVGHSACEATHCFQLLNRADLLLQRALAGHVFHVGFHAVFLFVSV